MLFCLDIGAEHGVHAFEVSLAMLLEPFQDVSIHAQVDRGFLPLVRHDHTVHVCVPFVNVGA